MAARGWSASRAAWAFTLLLLAAFTGSISLGAGSVGVAVVAFLFLLAAIAVATAARAKDYFRAYPADTSPVADFHIDDLKVDDDTSAAGLDGSELNSMADLERSMRRAADSDGGPAAPSPVASAAVVAGAPTSDTVIAQVDKATQATEGGDAAASVPVTDSSAASAPVESPPDSETPASERPPSETAAVETPTAETPADKPTVETVADQGTTPVTTSEVDSVEGPTDVVAETAASDPKDVPPQSGPTESGMSQALSATYGPAADAPQGSAESPSQASATEAAATGSERAVGDEPGSGTLAAESAPATTSGARSTTVTEQHDVVVPRQADQSSSPDSKPPRDTVAAMEPDGESPIPQQRGTDVFAADNQLSDTLMESLIIDDTEDPVTAEEADPALPLEESTTQLHLLAAESAGVDLLSAYADETTLPPDAVRDVAATLIVSDLAASVMFYTELLGLVEIDRARDAVLLEAGFGRVLLWRREDAPPSRDPVMHLTFEVGDIDTAYETLNSKGVHFTHPPRSALSGEVHDLRAASFLDPDGHGLAITELRQRTDTTPNG
ncbi:catechol 2,3-dioxygenase-like lactoylglutathione lyase family enzyme [Stackebrandtia endophytica]|uniref:Catechol 2,3-dioxygenase-like lactoylglutathione lyase family enzyme n=2 Tax=Stackebrandtia endophytica TaxID=1496996 RepID=A0A543AUB0_9ACTN|nr:catechol 2,3-dioxygenase-like lactoylglutathione lyase family enzyme [Stackebrandtia endophytica]